VSLHQSKSSLMVFYFWSFPCGLLVESQQQEILGLHALFIAFNAIVNSKSSQDKLRAIDATAMRMRASR
jgi:hypothetical protein